MKHAAESMAEGLFFGKKASADEEQVRAILFEGQVARNMTLDERAGMAEAVPLYKDWYRVTAQTRRIERLERLVFVDLHFERQREDATGDPSWVPIGLFRDENGDACPGEATKEEILTHMVIRGVAGDLQPVPPGEGDADENA